MFYTLTANPAIDMNIFSDGLIRKEVNRTRGAVYTANGKGVNVSLVLNHFGTPSTVLGFFGGFSGEYIVTECEKKGLFVKPVMIDDITRINVFLNDGEGEFKMVNEGPVIPEDKQAEFLKLLENLDDAEYLCISGSLPRGITPDFYDKIFQCCARKGTKVILDISSPKLKELLAYRPLLIKPNDEELRDVFGITLNSEEDVKSALGELHKLGAQNVLLTLGDKGSYFSDGKKVVSCSTYPVKLVSSVCAGDACLATFLSIWTKDKTNVEEALKKSAAAGANVAESAGLGDLKMVDEYSKHISVREIEK